MSASSPELEFEQAAQLVLAKRRAVPTLLKWELGVSEERAKELVAELEKAGIVGAPDALGSRQVLVKSPAELAQLLANPPVAAPPLASAATDQFSVREALSSPADDAVVAAPVNNLAGISLSASEPALELPPPVKPAPPPTPTSPPSFLPGTGPRRAVSPSPLPRPPAPPRSPAPVRPAPPQPVAAAVPGLRPKASAAKKVVIGCLLLLAVGSVLLGGLLWSGYRAVKEEFAAPASQAADEAAHAATLEDSPAAVAVDTTLATAAADVSTLADTVNAAADVSETPTDAEAEPAMPVAEAAAPADPAGVGVAVVTGPEPAAPAPLAASAPEALALSATVPAAPEPGDAPATRRVRETLAAFYADLQAPPFAAATHFAPSILRFNNLNHTTPEAVAASIQAGHFADYRDAVLQVEPHTLTVSEPASDGSRQASYVEQGRAYVVPAGRYQRRRTQVRVMVDASFRLTFFKSDRLLETVPE